MLQGQQKLTDEYAYKLKWLTPNDAVPAPVGAVSLFRTVITYASKAQGVFKNFFYIYVKYAKIKRLFKRAVTDRIR